MMDRDKLRKEALSFPVGPCTHDNVGDEDICDGCHYEWSKSLSKRVDAALDAAYAAGRAQGEWISVEERLPDSDDLVLIATNEGGTFTGKYRTYNGKCFWLPTGNATYAANWKVTHWMPLPSPPERGKLKEGEQK